MCPCLIWFVLFTLELLTALREALCWGMESSADLPVTSEIDMIAGACTNVQAGETALARECQPGHACIHAARCSLPSTDSHRTPLQKSCRAADPCSLITHTHNCMHTAVRHTPNNYTGIRMWFYTHVHINTCTVYSWTCKHKQTWGQNIFHGDQGVWTQCGNYPPRLTCANLWQGSSANRVIHNGQHYMHINACVHSRKHATYHQFTLTNTHVNVHKTQRDFARTHD